MRCDSKPCGRERRNGRGGCLRRGAATPRSEHAATRDAATCGRSRRGAAATPRDRSFRRVLALALGACALGGAAAAQEPEAATGPVVERIRSGFVVAPDLKITGVDGGSGALAGLYGGFVTDRRLLLGGGAYWLTGGPGSVDLAYGGGLVEWFANPRGRLDVSVRSLFGAGRATLTSDFETFLTGAGIPLFGPGLFGAGPAFKAGAGTAPLGPFPSHAGPHGRRGMTRKEAARGGQAIRRGRTFGGRTFRGPAGSRSATTSTSWWRNRRSPCTGTRATGCASGAGRATASSPAPGPTAGGCGASRPASACSWDRRRSLHRLRAKRRGLLLESRLGRRAEPQARIGGLAASREAAGKSTASGHGPHVSPLPRRCAQGRDRAPPPSGGEPRPVARRLVHRPVP